MIRRRRFLQAIAGGIAIAPARGRATQPPADGQAAATASALPPFAAGEDLPSYLQRTHGGWDQGAYRGLLGAANEYKEGDEIVGVAAVDENSRRQARELIANTAIEFIDRHPPHRDELWHLIERYRRPVGGGDESPRTLGDLRDFLLTRDAAAIHAIKDGLSSDTIACVVKLLTNQELIAISGKLFNPLPGSRIGAEGYLGARIQPNSPTDNPADIRWQVLDGFAYGVGDVLLGTNPVSSDPESVLAVQRTLQDLLVTFGLTDAMPHCVLAHIDVQAEVETLAPGSTELWFQSIAGNDSANATFDITIEKLLRHARDRRGPYGLYFETGQGADFTNGHGHGCDMLLHESRKYGLARALAYEVAKARGSEDRSSAWVHVNDVAGFIGPEVFRTREQLVRCCLEDLVMGKLHGLTIGLDVCSTLHMDVTLDDLDWCLEAIAPAAPAYLMALPTKIDPMLGYLTTGYQDHVRLRQRFGYRVNDRMARFFREIGVFNDHDQPGEHFGDPLWVFLQYQRRRGDAREAAVILDDGRRQMAEVRGRGLFLAEGWGERHADLAPGLADEIQRIYDDAKRSIWREWDPHFVATLPGSLSLRTQSVDREDYILHPASGETLDPGSVTLVEELRTQHAGNFAVQIVVSEGLNALALMDPGNLLPLLDGLRGGCTTLGLAVAPELLVLTSGRVRAGYQIGERLFADLPGRRTLLHVIGERPGSGHHTQSVYITQATGAAWGIPGRIDHDVTRVVSGIATTTLDPALGAAEVIKILGRPNG